MRKGTSGVKTSLVMFILIVGVISSVYYLTQTNLFEVSMEYIVQLAGETSIVDFKKSCKIYDSEYLMEHEREVKGTPIYYSGKIVEINTSAFGNSEVLIQVVGEKYNVDENTDIIIKMKNNKYLRANSGDKVKVYGRFNSVAKRDKHKIIYVSGVRIEAG